MKYLELFRLGVEHSYYSENRCADFAIAPDRNTQALLRNHRALAKLTPNGLRILSYATEDDETVIPIAEGSRLVFEMRLANEDFPLFTDLSDFKSQRAPVFIGSDSLELSLGSRTARHRDQFSVVEPAEKESFVLTQEPVPGLKATDVRLLDAGSVQRVTAYDQEGRLVSVDSRNAQPKQAFAVDYEVPPRRARGLFAEIEIEPKAPLVNLKKPAMPAPEYRIAFRAKSARWAYYCVTDRAGDLADFSVVDEPPGNGDVPLVFGDEWKTNLGTDPDPSDRLAQQLAAQYPKAKRYRFLSNDAVVCRERPHKGLRLHLGGDKLPGALANPSFRNFSTVEFSVGDTDRKVKQDCLTEIVKIMTESPV